MRVLFDVTHPAHVHLFRHSVAELRADGHETAVTARDKDVTLELLNQYDIPYHVLSAKSGGTGGMLSEWPIRTVRLLAFARSFDPDVIVSRFNPAAGAVARLLGCPALMFDDTEHKPAALRRVTYPLATRIYTPGSFGRDLGTRQRRYPGYHELAYLHPDRFELAPARRVRNRLGVDLDTPLVVMRLVSWQAPHDVGHSGFDDPLEAVQALEETGATVVLSVESEVTSDLEPYQASIPASEIHDVLAHADLFIGESGTMSIESAVLGTPAIFISSIHAGVLEELASRFGLLYQYGGPDKHRQGIECAQSLLAASDDNQWDRRRSALLEAKVDTTSVILQTIHAHADEGPNVRHLEQLPG